MTTRAGHYRPSFELHLTPKQREVLRLIECGKTNFEIAQTLGVSLEGAKYHVSEILGKLQVNSREEAVRAWREYNRPTARLHRAFSGIAALPLLKAALAVAIAIPAGAVVVVIVALARANGASPDSDTNGEAIFPSRTPTAVASVTATVTASASSTSEETPTRGTTTATPRGVPPEPEERTTLRAYFLRGDSVAPVERQVPQTQAVARAALEELLTGTTDQEGGAGLTSAMPGGTRLLSVTVANGVATVDLSAEFLSGGGTLSVRARLAQVVYTLTQFPTVDAVTFRIEGQETTVFGGGGVVIPSPVSRDEFEDLTPAILLDSPAQGATVTSPVRLLGTANTFEATFRIAIFDAAGNLLADQFATATSGSGTRGSFDVSVPFTVATAGPGTIRVYESSAQDGSPINIVDVPVQLER